MKLTVIDIKALKGNPKLYFFIMEMARDCLRALHAPNEEVISRIGHISLVDLVVVREFFASQVDIIISCGGIQNRINPKRRAVYNKVIKHIVDSFSLPDTGRIRLHLANQHIFQVEFIQRKAKAAA